jgi:hypothetical protein
MLKERASYWSGDAVFIINDRNQRKTKPKNLKNLGLKLGALVKQTDSKLSKMTPVYIIVSRCLNSFGRHSLC